jgi:hypothetical protein
MPGGADHRPGRAGFTVTLAEAKRSEDASRDVEPKVAGTLGPMTWRRVLPVLVGVAVIAAAGAVAYGWLTGLPPGPTVGFGQFAHDLEDGQVTTIVLRDNTLTVVDRQGHTYQVTAPDLPGVNASYLSFIQAVAAEGGHAFDAANYHEEAGPDTGWIGPFILAVALFVVVAGYLFYMTGPEPRAGPTVRIPEH